ncbi:MAG: hypothetical protein P8P83_01525 [Rickettsiaceae bacterium]|nr:hypothetical protein [Rickettsiaceae bacterium]
MPENKKKQTPPVRSKEDLEKSSIALRRNLQRRKVGKNIDKKQGN